MTKNIEVVLVNLLEQPRYMMERIDIVPDLISEDRIFNNFNSCIAWAKNKLENGN